MKKLSEKRRNGIINRHFLAFKEVPHSIELKKTNGNSSIFITRSLNHRAQIEEKRGFINEYILLARDLN